MVTQIVQFITVIDNQSMATTQFPIVASKLKNVHHCVNHE